MSASLSRSPLVHLSHFAFPRSEVYRAPADCRSLQVIRPPGPFPDPTAHHPTSPSRGLRDSRLPGQGGRALCSCGTQYLGFREAMTSWGRQEGPTVQPRPPSASALPSLPSPAGTRLPRTVGPVAAGTCWGSHALPAQVPHLLPACGGTSSPAPSGAV